MSEPGINESIEEKEEYVPPHVKEIREKLTDHMSDEPGPPGKKRTNNRGEGVGRNGKVSPKRTH